MALKKEYLTVDGEIYGEGAPSSGPSGWQPYTRDTLGSVSAIADSGGNLVSRIEYKAFGDVRTYTGENPLAAPRRFLWNGTWGYRFNERYRYYLSHYVRARHYSSLTGAWTTIDPLWPGEAAYLYVDGRVTAYADPSGMACKTYGGSDAIIKSAGNCAAIKAVAKKYGLPCNLIATTVYLENPGLIQKSFDYDWITDRPRTSNSTGMAQIRYTSGSSGYWSVSEAYRRMSGKSCCAKGEDLAEEMICHRFSGFPRKATKEERMRGCIVECLYKDPSVWADEAAHHLVEDCATVTRSATRSFSGPITVRDKCAEALCSAVYNTGHLRPGWFWKDRCAKAKVGGRSKDFLDCYDHVNKLCCND